LRAAVRRRGGSFGPFETLAEPEGHVFEPAIAADGNGQALAVWSTKEHVDQRDSGANRVRAAFFDPQAPTVTSFRALARGRRGLAYRATTAARVTVRVSRLRGGKRARHVITLTSARFARTGRLRLPRGLARRGRYRARLAATSRTGRKGLPRRITFSAPGPRA
jgi:hypothetical protein